MRAGCGSRTPGRTVYLYRANDADIEGLCFIRDGEPVTLDWKDMTILPRHKDVAKSRLKMSIRGICLLSDSEVD